jgi:hypothetical protein
LHLEPGLARVIGVHEIVDHPEERARLIAGYSAHIERITERETRDYVPQLREHRGEFGD